MEYLCTISNDDDNDSIKLFKCYNHLFMTRYNDIKYTKIKNILLESNNIESYFNIDNNLHYYKQIQVNDYADIFSTIIDRDLELTKLLPKHPSVKRKINLPEKYHKQTISKPYLELF